MTGSSTGRAVSDAPTERLRALGAGAFVHLHGTLERHLQGTERLLRRFGNREAVCLAGLYHAVYGTDGIVGRLVEPAARNAIIAIIGGEAEGLVYLYGACDRDAFHPRIGTRLQHRFVDRLSRSQYPIRALQLRDFCEITVANEIELAMGNAVFRTRHADELTRLFARMRGLVSEVGYATAREVLQS